MPKIGQTGYSVSQAVAELVDNAIDARCEGKLLSVEVVFNSEKGFIEVADDGAGMSEETAANSIRLAHSGKTNKLGEFGLGLKTAATSLGKKFRITTNEKGSPEEYVLEYDEDKWLREGDWTKHEMQVKTGIAEARDDHSCQGPSFPNLP